MSVETTARSKVIIDSNQAEQALNELTQEAKRYKDAMNAAAKANDKAAFDKAEQGWKRTSRAVKEAKKELFSVDSVMKNLSGSSMNQLRAAQRALTSELNKMTRGTAEYIAKSKQLKQVTGEIRKVRTEMTGLSGAQSGFFGKMANGFNRYGGMALGLVASLTGLGLTFRKLANDAEEYQQKVANLSALTGLVGDDLDWLSKKAKELSTSTTEDGIRITKSADEIVDAFTVMGSKKPELLENKEALAAVTTEALKLAEAAQMDTKTAVESLANVMNQFGAEADQASKFINVLAAGSKFGAAAVDKIAESVIRFGPAADSANISVEESVALVETLAEKGIDGERAGTALRTALIKLQTGADEFNPKVVGLNKALENLNAANLSAGDLVKIFGQEAYNAGSILVENVDRVKHYTDAVTDTNVATEQAIKNTETEKALRQQAMNQFKLAALELGTRLAPALRHVTLTGGTLVKVLIAMVKWIDEYGKYILVAAAGISAYTIALKAKQIWTNLVTIATRIATGAQVAFNTAIKTNPIGLIVSALAAAATAFALFSKKAKTASDEQKKVNEAVKEFDELMGNTKTFDDKIKTIDKLNKRQLDSLKQSINDQIASHEDYVAKLEMNRAKQMAKIQSDLDKQLNDDRVSEDAKGKLKEKYNYQVKLIEDRFNKEIELQNESVSKLGDYLNQVESAYKNLKTNVVEKTYEDLRDALNEHYAQQRLATQKSYQQGEIDKEERDASMQVLELAHLEALLALQKRFGEETYDTEYKLTEERIKLMESVQDAYRKILEKQIADNKVSNDKILDDNEKATEDFINAEFDAMQKHYDDRAKQDEQELERKRQLYEQYKQITDTLGASLGDLMGRMATDTQMTAEEVARSLILIAMDSLHSMMRIYVGELGIKNVARFGLIAGSVRTMLQSAAIEAIFAGVKAAVSQRAAGKYDVIGADDGRAYNNVPYQGNMRTGVYPRPTLVSERGDELIVDHGTLNNVRVNFPDVLPKIKAAMVPQRAAGNVGEYMASQSPDGYRGSQSDPELKALLYTLTNVLQNGIKADVSYQRFKEQQAKAERIESDTSRNP